MYVYIFSVCDVIEIFRDKPHGYYVWIQMGNM